MAAISGGPSPKVVVERTKKPQRVLWPTASDSGMKSPLSEYVTTGNQKTGTLPSHNEQLNITIRSLG